MTLAQIIELLDASVLTAQADPNLIVTSVRASDLMSDVLTSSSAGDVLLTGLVNAQSVRTADVVDIKVIVFVRGKVPAEETVKMADECNICLLATKKSMLEACGLLYAHLEK